MANYAEEIVFWYLRLNGFFPIQNFVLHDDVGTRGPAPECDLIAVRFPHTYERVGDGHTDPLLFGPVAGGIDQGMNHIIGVIVQVKGGKSGEANGAFNPGRILSGIQRLGFFPMDGEGETAATFHTALGDNPRLNRDGFIVAKLLFAEAPDADARCFPMPLSVARDFIIKRMKKYEREKHRDWVQFPSELIQYLIWHSPNEVEID